MRPRALPILVSLFTTARALAQASGAPATGGSSAPTAPGIEAPAAGTPATPPSSGPAKSPSDPTSGEGMVVHTFDASGRDTGQPETVTGAFYLNPGPLLTFVGGNQTTTAYGLEVSCMAFTQPTSRAFGAGAFVQGQVYEGKYPRFALGAQVAAANLGFELGAAYRQGDVSYDTTFGAQGAVFLSLGYVVLSFRAVFPVASVGDTHQSYGTESGLSIAVKLPLLLAGHDPTGLTLLAK